MGERVNLKSIWKSNAPEKLIVFHASSLEDEIRFYFNDEQYVVARDNKDGTFSIKCEEIQELENDKQDNESTLTYIKKNIKDKAFLKFLAFTIGISFLIATLMSVSTIAIIVLIDNILIRLLFINSMWLFMQVFLVVILECKFTSQPLQSKHSAEHMMVNFLEKNKRLPKNMKEIKETSRFCVDCGSRKKIRESTENFITSMFSAIIVFCIEQLIFQNYQNELLLGIIFSFSYIGIYYGVWILIHKYNKLRFIIKPIENMLNNIVQYSNTTKKVKNNDLQLAYYVAKHWLQIVYPEFYSEDDNDIFNESERS